MGAVENPNSSGGQYQFPRIQYKMSGAMHRVIHINIISRSKSSQPIHRHLKDEPLVYQLMIF